MRAAAFHMGVLRRLADQYLLEAVSQLSTVSGGTLLAATIFSRAGMRWPTSAEYREEIFPNFSVAAHQRGPVQRRGD